MVDKRLLAAFFGLTAALLLAACTPAPAGSGASDGSPSTPSSNRSGDVAPDFEITLYQGEEVIGAETVMLSEILDEGRPVVLNFWAGLCPPCRVEMPDLQAAYDNRSEELVLIGVDVGPFTNLGTREEGRQLLRELEVTYPAGTTFQQSILQEYSVLGMPSTYFITPQGEIIESWSGLLTEEKLTELMDELVAASS